MQMWQHDLYLRNRFFADDLFHRLHDLFCYFCILCAAVGIENVHVYAASGLAPFLVPAIAAHVQYLLRVGELACLSDDIAVRRSASTWLVDAVPQLLAYVGALVMSIYLFDKFDAYSSAEQATSTLSLSLVLALALPLTSLPITPH